MKCYPKNILTREMLHRQSSPTCLLLHILFVQVFFFLYFFFFQMVAKNIYGAIILRSSFFGVAHTVPMIKKSPSSLRLACGDNNVTRYPIEISYCQKTTEFPTSTVQNKKKGVFTNLIVNVIKKRTIFAKSVFTRKSKVQATKLPSTASLPTRSVSPLSCESIPSHWDLIPPTPIPVIIKPDSVSEIEATRKNSWAARALNSISIHSISPPLAPSDSWLPESPTLYAEERSALDIAF